MSLSVLSVFAVGLDLSVSVGLAIYAWKTKSPLFIILFLLQSMNAAIIWYEPPVHRATVKTDSKCASAPPFTTCERDGYEFGDVNGDCKADLILCAGRGTPTKPQIYLNNGTGWVSEGN